MSYKKVAIVMGSDSDLPVIKRATQMLDLFEIKYEVRVISAHRTPDVAHGFAKNAANNGFGVIIAAAGKAAHLGGVIAAYTTLPVIGLPIKSSTLDGIDSLLSIVQMPKGIPVATVAIDGGENAAILAAQILSLNDERLFKKLLKYKEDMAKEVIEKDNKITREVSSK
jgi:5-(carboxyamino)imidazole ribonucleotide mutase